jgi:hypothetical protein
MQKLKNGLLKTITMSNSVDCENRASELQLMFSNMKFILANSAVRELSLSSAADLRWAMQLEDDLLYDAHIYHRANGVLWRYLVDVERLYINVLSNHRLTIGKCVDTIGRVPGFSKVLYTEVMYCSGYCNLRGYLTHICKAIILVHRLHPGYNVPLSCPSEDIEMSLTDSVYDYHKLMSAYSVLSVRLAKMHIHDGSVAGGRIEHCPNKKRIFMAFMALTKEIQSATDLINVSQWLKREVTMMYNRSM